jgi:MOSC domain-containing protein YiiM
MSAPTVIAVASDSAHNFSKIPKPVITLIAGFGVEGDAHAGRTVQHLWDKKRTPDAPNLRQVHLVHEEIFAELAKQGFTVKAGDIGENIVTRGIDLLGLPLGTQLAFESGALIELTGLRNPCKKLNKIQDGLIHKFVAKGDSGERIVKSGVMSIVLEGGDIRPSDSIDIILPDGPHKALPIL